MTSQHFQYEERVGLPCSCQPLCCPTATMLLSKPPFVFPSSNYPCPYDDFWVHATWSHPQPSHRCLLQIIQYWLCPPPVRQYSRSRYSCKNDADCCILCRRKSEAGSGSILWYPLEYQRHRFLQRDDHVLFP